MNKNILEQYYKAIFGQIQSEVKYINNLITHPGEKGKLNENVLIELLKKFLPSKYSIGSGFVIDGEGRISKQFDIIIYDNFYNSSFLAQKTIGLFPIEIVYLVIQVKTSLTHKEIKSSIKNLESLKILKFNSEHIAVPEIKEIFEPSSLYGASRAIESFDINGNPKLVDPGSTIRLASPFSEWMKEEKRGEVGVKKTTRPLGVIFSYTSRIKNKTIIDYFRTQFQEFEIDGKKAEDFFGFMYILSNSLFAGWINPDEMEIDNTQDFTWQIKKKWNQIAKDTKFKEENLGIFKAQREEYRFDGFSPGGDKSDEILTKGFILFLSYILALLNMRIITRTFSFSQYLPDNFDDFLHEVK